MKKIKNCLYIITVLVSCNSLFSQQEIQTPFSIEADYFYGNIFEHNKEISHLIVGHPSGISITYNRKTYGLRRAERIYNYPDWGFTFAYQQFQNPSLGKNYALYGHYGWYFLKRKLRFSLATGIAFNTNPYDREKNPENNAYGTSLLSTSIFKLSYIKENIWNGFGLQAGLSLIHYSNANLKAPNTSTNTFAFNLGVNYLFDHGSFPEYIPLETMNSRSFAEAIHYNFVFRLGMNESDVIGQGQSPFFVFSVFADKRINYKSSFQAGIDVFFSHFLKELIYYRSIAYPEDGLTGDEDYKRVGVFVGHELRLYDTALITQLGYYAYWPYQFEQRVYNRLGLKRYFGKTIYASVSVKSQWAKAEGIEFGLGVRFK